MTHLKKDFRIFDFAIYNESNEPEETEYDDDEYKPKKDTDQFVIQMFGKNTEGETCSIKVMDFEPFFYVKVTEKWQQKHMAAFKQFLIESTSKYYSESITKMRLVDRKKLYGFDGGKQHKFIEISFRNTKAMNKIKNLWYDIKNKEKYSKYLKRSGLFYKKGPDVNPLDKHIQIYEGNIPPLLRYFHLHEISPSGWISVNANYISMEDRETYCDYEYEILTSQITALNDKEDIVPFKICSFDIEASSSHGDFPLPVKSYKKLATNVVDYFARIKREEAIDIEKMASTKFDYNMSSILYTAFASATEQFETIDGVDLVYPKRKPKDIDSRIQKFVSSEISERADEDDENDSVYTLEMAFESMNTQNNDDDTTHAFDGNPEEPQYGSYSRKDNSNVASKKISKCSIQSLITSKTHDRESKINMLTSHMGRYFPQLEGDKVTFIGSTFMRYGEQAPYYNHCIALDTCDDVGGKDTEIVEKKTEREVLLEWTNLIQEENPDIIIGYNIFGFDYRFMFERAKQNNCEEEFLMLSRNRDELCGNTDRDGRVKIEESSIIIASGQHDLYFIKMNGRLQIDLYNYFRRDYNLTSYKLDYVAGSFIGDGVAKLEPIQDGLTEEITNTYVYSKNLKGLLVGSYINFEEISHSSELYLEGKKFVVTNIAKSTGRFTIRGNAAPDIVNKKVRWGLAKDDVTPQDIFRMTNEGPASRAVIAKYCIQDCNLVHYLMNKIDVITGFIEMAKICSVPMNFLVMRGQGIKLTSYIAKKCREKGTLMPDIEKATNDGGYEGAIVLPPKSNLYLDNPVACVDYSSLYPSSMISENLSHDSKVWTKEYDLDGNLIQETGEKDAKTGEYKYDNMEGYEYVDVTYDTYRYVRKTPSAAAVKVISGSKVCRWAQFPNHAKAIMPSILEELLAARKATRKQIPLQKDDFMKNILDKRQLSYKVTANSLYGQCGARTSTFYEKDVAASTTATGRKLLTYGKRVIEEVYGDLMCETKYGLVHSKAEYIYGDSVADYTPVYVMVGGKFDICSMGQLSGKYGNGEWKICKEIGREDKEVCNLSGVKTWTDTGWTEMYRIIRHKLSPEKRMKRILTHTGVVDVTDDHSLILDTGKEISPKDVEIGTKLLHKTIDYSILDSNEAETNISVDESDLNVKRAKIYGFFFGDGSCGLYDCSSGKKSTWALNNSDETILQKYLDLCKEVYPEYTWKIYDTIGSSGVNKISFNTFKYGETAKFIKRFKAETYEGKSKIIPQFIMNASKRVREAYWEGLYDADGDKDKNNYTRIDQKSQLSAGYIAALANSIGYKTSINTRADKPDIYRVTATKQSKQRKCPEAIKRITDITDYYNSRNPEQQYVYDLTTENHHFAAGVGNMIVHNTDSVFFTFNLADENGVPIRGEKALEITIELAKEAGELATKFLKKPHDLEYEKTFMPFCLLSKKRYVGMLYEEDPTKCERKSMGIVLKRRDNAPIVKDVYGGIIDILMKDKNIKAAVDFLTECLVNIVNEKYPIEKLIITKSLRSHYKNPDQIAHKVLADRIGKRDPGNKPSNGDRIPFVYIKIANKKALQGEKIETPSFIAENKLKPNYAHYITNQIMKPVIQVFALVLEELPGFKGKFLKEQQLKREMKTINNNLELTAEARVKKTEALRNKYVRELLFDKYIKMAENTTGGVKTLDKFF
jgi:DNA polymerase elongation subunit (family B)